MALPLGCHGHPFRCEPGLKEFCKFRMAACSSCYAGSLPRLPVLAFVKPGAARTAALVSVVATSTPSMYKSSIHGA